MATAWRNVGRCEKIFMALFSFMKTIGRADSGANSRFILKRIGLLFVLAVAQLRAYQSLTVPAGASVLLSVPSTAPFTAFGDYRVAFRLHDWTAPASGYTPVVVFANASFRLLPNSLLCAGNYGADQQGDYGNWECVSLAGLNDVVVRFQRFGNSYPSSGIGNGTGSTVLEAQDLSSGQSLPSYCAYNSVARNQFPCVIDVAHTTSVSGNSTMGGQTGYSLAWLKWSSATVPPENPMDQESTPADLADFRFEGNFTNQGTGGYTVTLTLQSGAPAFSPTDIRPPACNLQQAVFRAGQAVQLAGSAYPLDGGSAISYFWQEVSGPTKVVWSGRNTLTPTIRSTAFGSYVFRLTVSDGSGQTSACTVKDGFVATDANGVVVSANPLVDLLLGPQIQLWRNPWSWYDNRHVAEAALQITNLATYFGGTNPLWNVPGVGTIGAANNSASITGINTTFTTTFCQGPANPTMPKPGAVIVIWYPLATVPAGSGRRKMAVASCQSDTQLTLTNNWNAMGYLTQGSGWSYNYTDGTLDSVWITNAAPANFYDAVAAFYALYYRSGIDDYQTAARTLADNFWQYRLDSGRNYFPSEGFATFPRNESVLGMVLRALDGRPDMWSGLELIFNYQINQFHSYFQARGPWLQNSMPYDPREGGYMLAEITYCALIDPSQVQAAACRGQISETFTKGYTPSRDPDGNFYTLYQNGNNNSWTTKSYVTLTNGSTAVTCVGTCNWQAGIFSTNINGTNYTVPWWFTYNSRVAPTSNAGGVPIPYYLAYIDPNHATLQDVNGNPLPFQQASGNYGWVTGVQSVGFGVQPYMLGILATAWDFASKAMTCVSPGMPAGCDDTIASTARSYNVQVANYLRTVAYWPASGGMYYVTSFINCQAPISDTNVYCTEGNNASQARTLSAEAMRGVMTGYANSADPNLLAFGDTLYSAMWGKSGFAWPAGQTVDGRYIWDYNDGLGWYVTGAPPVGSAHKYFGMAFGIGAGGAWPGYRLGGAHTGTLVGVAIDFRLDSVRGAAAADLLITYPTGATSSVRCAAAPCSLTFDQTLGNPTVQIQYLSADGAVLATQPLPTEVVLQ